MARQIALVRRYNADGSLSILARGLVMIRFELGWHSSAEPFARGWFGDGPVKWGKPQFRFSAAKLDEAIEVVDAIHAGEY